MARIVKALATVAAVLAVLPSPSSSAGPVDPGPDFDGDGYADLAIGAPYDRQVDAEVGSVDVLYGGAEGLSTDRVQHWNQDTDGVIGAAEELDRFGSALAAGDFDGDGYDDLAIGAPDEDLETGGDPIRNMGAVNVLYGLPGGLTSEGDQQWWQGAAGLPDMPETFDRFGTSLGAGDLDGDGYDDLVVGVVREAPTEDDYRGAVQVLYGSASGLTATGSEVWDQDSPGMRGIAETGDAFGFTVLVADLGGSPEEDIAVGVPGDRAGDVPRAGSVHVLFGSPGGVTAAGDLLIHQDSPGVPGVSELDDRFGWALAAADLDGDGHAELAVGVPQETFPPNGWAGAVHVLAGTAAGPTTAGGGFWHQDVPGVANSAAPADMFGFALAAGSFGGDANLDLAVGVPGEDLAGLAAAGAIHLLLGGPDGLSAAGDRLIAQPAVTDAGPEEGDVFAITLSTADFDGDGRPDLAAGARLEDRLGEDDVGSVDVLYGARRGLSTVDAQSWTQWDLGIVAYDGERFGAALTDSPFTTPRLTRQVS